MFETEVARTRVKDKVKTWAGKFLAHNGFGYYLTASPILNTDCVFHPTQTKFLQEKLWQPIWWDRVKDLAVSDFEFVHYQILMEEDKVKDFPLF